MEEKTWEVVESEEDLFESRLLSLIIPKIPTLASRISKLSEESTYLML